MARKPSKKNKSDFSINVKDLEPSSNPKGGVTATTADEPGTLKATDSSGLKADVITNSTLKAR